MMPAVGNWCAETCSTVGTGDLILTGALQGLAAMQDVLDAGSVYYSIEDGENREAGIGTFNGTNTIVRTTVTATLVGGVYDDTSPTAISLSGNAIVGSTITKTAFDEKLSTGHVADTNNPHSVTKTQVGLGNVDNTSDANKPVSTAQQAALDLKQDIGADVNLDALLETLNTNTIVDVFIYETASDDDGGAWVDKANYQSWYHETLNTATRGATKAFPRVCAVVAEATKVTIYDLTDSTCPMWMVFNQGGSYVTSNNLIGATSGTIKSVNCKNGLIYIGTNEAYYDVDFIKETSVRISLTAKRYYNGSIAERNSGSGSGDDMGATYIVNATVNDIAVTSDGNMGNYVAVGTDGSGTYSTSVITPSGSVYDVASDSTGTAVSVDISSGNELIVCRSDGTVYVWNSIFNITSDGVSPDTTITDALGTASVVEAA